MRYFLAGALVFASGAIFGANMVRYGTDNVVKAHTTN